jgi:hypothetical protein
MLKSIDANTLIATAKEIVDEIFDYEGGSGKYHKPAEYLEHANERLNNAPLDAFILFALSYDMGRLQWSVANAAKQGGRFTYSQTDAMNADSLFANLKRRLCKDLYKKSEDVFKPVVHMGGTKYPSCEWGVTVTVDGNEMEQYT